MTHPVYAYYNFTRKVEIMSLLDTTKGLLTPELISTATKGLGVDNESPSNVRKTMENSVPVLFMGMAQVASSDSGASRLFDTVTERDYGGLLGRFGSMKADQAEEVSQHGQSMINRLFGDRASGIIELISSSSGVGRSSAAALLGLAAPVVAGVLGREVNAKGLSAGGLADLLSHQKQSIANDPRTPTGLAALFGSSSLPGASGVVRPTSERLHDAVPQDQTRRTTPRVVTPVPQSHSTSKWLVPALLGVLLIGGLWTLLRNRSSEVAVTQPERRAPVSTPPVAAPIEAPRAEAPPPVEAPKVTAPVEAPQNAPEVVEQLKITAGEMTLPGGKVLAVNEHGSEAELARYLDSGAANAPKRFPVDGVNFQFGTTALSGSGEQKLDAVADVLEAYPSARVRIEGHTDSIGTPDVNKPLSLARAQAIRKELSDRNVAPERIEVAGLGAEHPAVPNDTPQGRAQNRRIDILVLGQ